VPKSTRRWKDVLSENPVNEKRAELYRRIIEAQERIAQAQYRRGVDHEVVLAALDAVDEKMSDAERADDLYLSALKYYVDAIVVRSDPEK
jgi:hypothetical protein